MRPAALALALALALTGCTPGDEPEPPTASYTPTSDEALFEEVAQLPGVIEERLRWMDDFSDSNRYGGAVFVRRKADQCRVLDQTYAILRKGRPDVDISIGVKVGKPSARQNEGLTMAFVAPDLVSDPGQRYGPQPGDGRPPDDELCRDR